MIHDLLLGLGLVAVIEGLVFALVPLHFEEILKAIGKLSRDQRRVMGVGFVAFGVAVVWVAKNSL